VVSAVELADVFRAHGPQYRQQHTGEQCLQQLRAMRAIEVCRTAELGGHVDECDHCGKLRISYNSCRNRHCPKCQSLDKESWLEARRADLLAVPYFHVVFTVPEDLRPVALRNQKVFYNLLFKAASQALMELAHDPRHLGAQIGATALLHTWTQTLIYHPHVHFIVPGGGLSPDGRRWIRARSTFFLPVKALSRLFRGKLLAFLKEAYDTATLSFSGQTATYADRSSFQQLLDRLYGIEWRVYCKPPFASPEQTLEYLGRYTHRVALSNDRILSMQEDQITFRYRDSDRKCIRQMTLSAEEFIRRFLLHVLPSRFVKIRHYGIMSTRNRQTKLARCKELLGCSPTPPSGQAKIDWQERLLQVAGVDLSICPSCGQGHMRTVQVITPARQRAPPGVCSPLSSMGWAVGQHEDASQSE